MRLGSILRLRFRSLFSRNKVELELEEELRYHLERQIDEEIAARRLPEEARYTALQSIKNIEQRKEECRDMRGVSWFENAIQDLRHGFRMLRKTPGFAFVAVMTLALGIGANNAIFSLLNGVLLRPLPGVPSPGSLVLFSDGNFEGGFVANVPDPGLLPAYTFPLYVRLRDQRQLFDLAAEQSNYSIAKVEASGSESNAATDQAMGRCVSANFFDVLGVSAFRGRTFQTEDQTAAEANPVIVLSYAYWQRRFGGNPAVIGSRLIVNASPYTVIGITPRTFMGTTVGEETDFWVPLTMQAQLMRRPDVLSRRDMWWLVLIGRLKPRVSLAQAQAKVNVVLQQYLAQAPTTRTEFSDRKLVRIELLPGAKGVSPLREKLGLALFALMGGVGLLLLIACVNLSHLLLTRSIRCRREIALKLMLGASRMRVLRQLLTEALLLCSIGGVAGLILGRLCSHALLRLASSGPVPLAVDVNADTRVFAFTLLLTVATGALFSSIPLWHALRIQLNAGLLAVSRTSSGSLKSRSFSRLLLISEVALSLLLLTGAALLVQTLRNLKNFDKGFRQQHVLLVDFSARLTGLTPLQLMPVYRDLLDRISVVPGVQSASLALQAPLTGSTNTTDISLPGYTPKSAENMEVEVMIVTPRYFETMGRSLLQGHYFSREDRANTPKVAIVNETFARRFLGAEPLNRHFGTSRDNNRQFTVVGVVRNAKLHDLRSPAGPVIYLPLAQAPDFLKCVLVRTAGDPTASVAQIRWIMRDVNPDLFILYVATLEHQVDRLLVQETLIGILSSSFGAVGLLLVCIGLYGVLSQNVAQRTAEIGIRMALGAQQQQVRWLVLREALSVVLIGLGIGVPISLAADQALTKMLFDLKPSDPLSLSICCIVVLLIAALASLRPAWRASRLDPMNALRYE